MSTVPSGYQDLLLSFQYWRVFTLLGWQRVKGSYRRTLFGDFWVTINKAIFIGTLGFVFSYVVAAPRAEYIPHLAVGIVFWTLIGGNINTSCQVFVIHAGTIKSVPLPLHTHLLQLYWQNLILLGHNLLIIPGIWWYAGVLPEFSMAVFLPGLLILQINLGWIGLLCAILCTRFRDFEQIIGNVMQIGYFLTPIMWLPEQLLGKVTWTIKWFDWSGDNWLLETYSLDLMHLNPFYHFIELVRAPLLLQAVDSLHWWFAGILAICGWIAAIITFQYARSRILYWL